MNVTHRWQKALVVGCSHGLNIDSEARAAVLRFRRAFKPDYVAHLGDWIDTAAFRRGAVGTQDQSADCKADREAGKQFLRELEPTTVFCGNHEHRLWSCTGHWDARIKDHTTTIVEGLEDFVREELHAQLITYDCAILAWRALGDYKLGHGYLYNETAARDMAEAHGNIVFAHTHSPQSMHGRRDDNPIGLNVGTLTRMQNMDFAHTRRKTLSWGGGFVWGFFHQRKAQLWLHDNGQKNEWVLPKI